MSETARDPVPVPVPASLRRRRANKPPPATARQAQLDSIVERLNPSMRDGARSKIDDLRRFLDGSVEQARDDFKALSDSLSEQLRAGGVDPAAVAVEREQLQSKVDAALAAAADADAARVDALDLVDGLKAQASGLASTIATLALDLESQRKGTAAAVESAGAATTERDRLATNIADAIATLDGLDVSTTDAAVRGELASLRSLLVR